MIVSTNILEALKEEREKLDNAIQALESNTTTKKVKDGRKGKRRWSAASKKALSAALRASWKKRKQEAKAAA